MVEEEMSSAIYKGDISSVERLIDAYGLNYSEVWSGGFNLLNETLKLARNFRNPQVAMLLLTKGAEVNTTKSHASTPLHYAALANHYEVVKELLERGAMVNATDESGQTPLHVAVSLSQRKAGYFQFNLEIIHLLLRSGADVNATDLSGGTPLLYAIKNRESKCVEMLIQYCTNINFQSVFKNGEFRNYTILQYAVQRRRLETIELLLKKGADVNIVAKHGESALHIAANKLYRHISEDLLNRGANVNAVFTSGPFEGFTPLHTVFSENIFYNKPDKEKEVVEMLVSHGANVNAPSKNRLTPLHMATYQCNEDQVKLLLKHGADPNIFTKDRMTALCIAVEKGSSKIVEHILKYSADLKNDHHADILRVALFNNKHFSHDIIGQLLDYGFSVANEPKKASMFHQAVKEGSAAIVEELLNHGFLVNKRYRDKMNYRSWSFMPLQLAIQENCLSVARLLICHGAVVNALDKAGKTAISYLCLTESTSFQMLKLLLENGAKPKDNPALLPSAIQYDLKDAIKLLLGHDVDVNAKDDSGLSALHHVFSRLCGRVVETDFKFSLQLVKLLLERKADVNCKTKTDIAVLHIAAMLDPQYLELLQTLLEYNADVNIRCDTITPLHLCAFKRNSVFCRVLLRKGADANAKLENGKTAAHLIASARDASYPEAYTKFEEAFECFKESDTTSLFTRVPVAYNRDERLDSDLEMLKALVEFAADLNVKDIYGITPLHEAAENELSGNKLIPTLIKHGADWMARDTRLQTPLYYAARSSPTNARILVEFGADINSKDVNGSTPLHWLAEGMSGKVYGLLDLGSDVNVVNTDNQTPLEVVVGDPFLESVRRKEVIEILIRHIIKLKAANLHIDSRNLIALESLKGGDLYDDHYRDCEREVDRLKAEMIGESNVSFHDFLTSGRRELIRLAKNYKLVQALKEEKFREFPNYAPELILKVLYLKQAPRRSNVLEKSKEVFVVCFADLSDLCLDVIFDDLSDDDLENLVRVRYPFQVFPETNYSECGGYLPDLYNIDYEFEFDDWGVYYEEYASRYDPNDKYIDEIDND